MNWVLFPLIWAVTCVLWCIGGQFWKPARRYLISVLMTAYAYFANREAKKRRVALVFLAMIGILSAGYGEDSFLHKRLCHGIEWLSRLVMAALIASVFVAYSIMTHHVTPGIFLTYGVNVLAWQIRAGSLGKIGKYDILVEDLCRASAFSVSLLIA